MLEHFRDVMTPDEMEVAGAIFQIPRDVFDLQRCRFEVRGNFLVGAFVSACDSRCPFEIHFGKGKHAGRFNFYVGYGAEFCSYESIDDKNARRDFGKDVQLFLQSTVMCEKRFSSAGELEQATYWPSRLVIDKMQVKLTYGGSWLAPFLRKEKIQYQSWLDAE